jgi:hypothetical protein
MKYKLILVKGRRPRPYSVDDHIVSSAVAEFLRQEESNGSARLDIPTRLVSRVRRALCQAGCDARVQA